MRTRDGVRDVQLVDEDGCPVQLIEEFHILYDPLICSPTIRLDTDAHLF